MNHTITAIVGLASAFLMTLRIAAADAQPSSTVPKVGEPASYPWSEASDYSRVPKSFLSQITIHPITMTNTETRQFVLTDEFVQTFKLTPSEVERMTASLADALHQYRMEEGRHLQPTNEVVDVGPPQRRGPAAVEKFSFELVPFPEEARAIRRQLEEIVPKTLGEERSNFFWQSEMMLGGEMNTFSRESPPGTVQSTAFTYQLTDANPGPFVDFYKSTTTRRVDGRAGGGGGYSGITYTAPLDQYAPEAMKPVLVRWRKAIADGTVRSKAPPSPEVPRVVQPSERVSPSTPQAKETAVAKSSPPRGESPTQSTTPWDDKSPFVDLPKSVIKSLQVVGLTPEGGISPEAVTLFGLKPEEGKSVRALYDQMKVRFEQVERAHFARMEPGKMNFAIRAFPEKSEAFQLEWTAKLKDLVGKTRGELLDHSIRTQHSPFQMMRQMRQDPRAREDLFRGLQDRGPDWLHRGNAEVQLDVSPAGAGRDGQPTYQIEYRTQGEGGTRGSWGGRADQFPERWRHLLTPDILGTPLTL